MNKTKIEWCDMTWNPITGCLHGCEYCYARRVAARFGSGDEDGGNHLLGEPMLKPNYSVDPYPYGFDPTFHRYRLGEPAQRKTPQNIFVCSMADLFGEWVSDGWISEVFAACRKAPQHRYLFLTKNPDRYAELDSLGLLPHEKNFWYGITATDFAQMDAACDAIGALPKGVRTFLSVEPLLCDLAECSSWWFAVDGRRPYFNWVIIGAMTGPGAKKAPVSREWVGKIVDSAEKQMIPVFMKDSLIPIMGEAGMVREFPWKEGA